MASTTNFEKIHRMSLDDLADWFAQQECFDCPPWIAWMDNKFCKTCDPIVEHGSEYAPCELGECPYNMAEISDKKLIKMWLEAECEEVDVGER